jgi:hypothetical protein
VMNLFAQHSRDDFRTDCRVSRGCHRLGRV